MIFEKPVLAVFLLSFFISFTSRLGYLRTHATLAWFFFIFVRAPFQTDRILLLWRFFRLNPFCFCFLCVKQIHLLAKTHLSARPLICELKLQEGNCVYFNSIFSYLFWRVVNTYLFEFCANRFKSILLSRRFDSPCPLNRLKCFMWRGKKYVSLVKIFINKCDVK